MSIDEPVPLIGTRPLDVIRQREFDQQITALRNEIAALRDWCGTSFSAQEKAVLTAMNSAQAAVVKAENASEKRFEGVNEFRETLADQQRTLMPRQEAERFMQSLSEKIDKVQSAVDQMQSERIGVKGGYGYAAAILGFVLTILAVGGFLVQYLSLRKP